MPHICYNLPNFTIGIQHELLTYKTDGSEYTYYLDDRGKKVMHGEFKGHNGRLWEHSFWNHGRLHGEFKNWKRSGELKDHFFYIDGRFHPYVKMTEQEKLLFQIQYPGFRFIED